MNLDWARIIEGVIVTSIGALIVSGISCSTEACKPVRQFRNKRVGHNDLNTTTKPQDNPLLGIGRKQIDRITQLAEQILQVVNQRFDNSELIFEPFHIGAAHDLIYWLKEAKEYENEKRQADLGYAAEKN